MRDYTNWKYAFGKRHGGFQTHESSQVNIHTFAMENNSPRL